MAKKRDDVFYTIVKEHLGGPSDAERAENKMNEYNKQNKEANLKLNKIANGNRDSFITKEKLANARIEFAKKVDKNANKYLNKNLEKQTKSYTNTDVSLQDTSLNNYNTVKNTVDNYVSQRNRNDENVRVFTPERNQAKSNQIVNNIYGTASYQADEDEYNATLDSLEKEKKKLEGQKDEIDKNKRRYYTESQKETIKTLNEQIDYVDSQIQETKKQYNDKLYQREKSLIYANNGIVTNTLQDYTFATEGAKMKGSTLSDEENAKLEALRKSWEASNKKETEATEYNLQQKKNNLQSQIDAIKEKIENQYPEDYLKYQLEIVDVTYGKDAKVVKNIDAKDYSKESLKLFAEMGDLQSELEGLDSENSKVSIRLTRGAELAYEDIEDNEETRLAILAGIEDTDDNDENFQRLSSQYVREEDRTRYYYIKGKYGSEAAKSYALYAEQQANTLEGLQEAYENNTLEEFHNAASNGLLGFFEGWWDEVDALATEITGKEGVLKPDYTRINSASDVELQKDKEQAGKVKRFLLDVTNTTANQLPSIALTLVSSGVAGAAGASASTASSIGQAVGMGSLSVSAAGNAYSEALREGKSTDAAFVYGGMQGIMEFATEKILGGQYGMNGALEKYGEKALKNVMPKLIKNETFRTYAQQAGKVLINSAGEFNEEAIQQILEPYIRNIAFGEDNKQSLQNVEDALYNGLLGMASAGATNTGGVVTSGVANSIANKVSTAKGSKSKGSEIISNLNSEKQVLSNTNENSALNKTNENPNTDQTETTEAPSVESVISESETNQKTARRITKILDKVDSGETVTDSEIAELKYNETASDMLGQMAGLKENKITSDLDNETVRAVINEAQNGKKNIDTTSILSNIRSMTRSAQNTVQNTSENASGEVLTANEGNLTNVNQRTSQGVAEASMPSQLSEAMPENIIRNAEGNYINNIEANNLTANEETAALNDSSYIENVSNSANAVNKVENNANKILQLGISNEKTGSANIRKVESVNNGVAQLLMTNGEIISADTLDFSGNQNAEIILTNAGKYNSSTANTFIANYDSSTSTAQEYSTAFNSVYKMAETGVSVENIASRAAGARTVLGEKAFNAAIRAGRNTAKGVFSDNASSKAKNTAKTNNKKSASQKNNTVNRNNLKKSKNNTKTKSQNKADNTHKTKKTDEVAKSGLKNRNKLNTSSAKKNVSQKSKTVNANKLEKTDNDAKLSVADEKSSWKPIKPSEKTQKVLDRLAKDKPVTLDLISELPEIAEAYARRGDINPTININTEERKQLRIDIQNEVENLGSARLDNNGEWVYNGNIARKSRIDIVIGLPAAGKSTVLANPLSKTYESRIVDSDVVKEKLPEYDNGYGADHVHKESKLINKQILEKAIANGENIVLPIVGSNYTKLLNQIKDYKAQGYSVYLHLNKLPMNKSLGRMLNRFLTDGRFLDPTISYKYQNKPTEVFERIIKTKGELLDGYSEYSNDVERGEDPIFIRGTENIQEAYKRADKGTTETNSKRVRGSRRDVRGNLKTTEQKYSIASETEEKLKSLNKQNNGSDSGNSVDKQGESGIINTRKEIRKSVEIPQNCKHLLDAETNFEGKDISTDILTAIDKTIDDRLKEKSDFRFDEIKVAGFPNDDRSVFITNLNTLGAMQKTQLYLNKDYFYGVSKQIFDERCLEHYESDWWKSKSLEDLVNHEIMHARINYNNTYKKVERLYQTLREDKRVKGFCRFVDKYPDEFLNEMYVALNNGEKVDKKYIDVYNEYLKEFLGGF